MCRRWAESGARWAEVVAPSDVANDVMQTDADTVVASQDKALPVAPSDKAEPAALRGPVLWSEPWQPTLGRDRCGESEARRHAPPPESRLTARSSICVGGRRPRLLPAAPQSASSDLKLNRRNFFSMEGRVAGTVLVAGLSALHG